MASAPPIAAHVLPETAAIGTDGSLSIGGVDVVDLAQRFGTPLFIYDEEHLRRRCREAVAAFGSGVAYGTKAFLCKAMARLVYEEGMMLDVSTSGELAVVRAAGVPADRVVLHGNNKSVDELESAFDERIDHIVVDSFDEIERIERISQRTTASAAQRLYLRVTPGVEAHTHEFIMTGQEDSKFGFSIASGAAAEAIDRLSRIDGVDLVGVHAHIGSQIFRLEGFEQEIAALQPLIMKYGFKEMCVGGGLGVAYLNDEQAPSLTEWSQTIKRSCATSGVPEHVIVTTEPGRSIAAAAGVTCYRVGTIKKLDGIRTYVAVDGGMSDNPRPILYGSGYEAFVASRANAPRDLACRIVGKHCESGDVLVADARLPSDVAIGDVVVTPVTGAYGHSMASNYNRLPRPAVVFVRAGEAAVVVRRETIADLLALEP